MKKWQCTVCGYIHTGDEPPEKCPVCGADKSQFVEITDSQEAAASDAEGKKASSPAPEPPPESKPHQVPGSLDHINDLLVKHHLHPISVHFPNGMVPAIVLFLFLALIFHSLSLSKAEFYNTAFVFLTLPVVLYTGLNEWKRKYKGLWTGKFITKMAAASIVTASVVIIVIWHFINPAILRTPSRGRTIYILLHLIMLGATAVAGYIGGKLVFKD